MQISITFSPSQGKAEYRVSYIIVISLIAALGGLLFGYDWVVIGGAKPFFERYFLLQDAAQSGWANSCALIGCLFGALVAGALGDRFGRKRLLAAAALIFAVTSLGNAFAQTFTAFVAWRIFGGVAIGLASNLSPLYIAEVAPPAWRGRLVSLNQLTIVLGIVLAQLVNWFLVRDLPGRRDRRVDREFLVWSDCVAVDVRSHRHPRGALLRGNCLHPGKSTLARRPQAPRPCVPCP